MIVGVFQGYEHYPSKNLNNFLRNKKKNNLNFLKNYIFLKN